MTAPPPRSAGFVAAVWSEWTKVATVRSTLLVLAATGLALPVVAVAVALTGSLQDDDTILGASLLGGAALAQVLAGVFGAGLITSELGTGTMPVTLAACPRRLVVLAAKALVAAAVTFTVTSVAGAAAFGIGCTMLDRTRYAPGEPWPALVGVALAMAFIAVLGVGIGTVVRHPAGAVTAVTAVVLLPGLVAPLLGEWRRWVGGASLSGVLQKLTQSSDATAEAVGSLGAWASLGVVATYTTAFLLPAVWILRQRDL